MRYLVTGANGHLGNNILRELAKQGKEVIACVRNTTDPVPFEGIHCEKVYGDITDLESLRKAFQNIDVIYHCAAIFKHWSKNPEKEILQGNLVGTENLLTAAEENGVKKILYVSSIAALDHSLTMVDETTWGRDFPNPYWQAKNQAELLLWKKAKSMNIKIISVLPSGMIGPRIFSHRTPMMDLLHKILNNALPFDPQFTFDMVHVQDVARGAILAEQKGCHGERYILSGGGRISSTELISMAKAKFKDIRIPPKRGKGFQLFLASLMEWLSKITGKAPLLIKGNVKFYFKAITHIDNTKAKKEFGYSPRPIKEAIEEALDYMGNR